MPFLRAAALAVVPVLIACSPTFNWRDWAIASTPLQTLMPCKPEQASREVPLLGNPVELHMHSCETGDLRFAVAWADVGNPARVSEALSAWRAASLQTLRVASSSTAQGLDWPVRLDGASSVQGVQAQGTDPQGLAVQARMAYFSVGTQVFQVAVYGHRLPDDVVEPFFSGLRLPSP